MTNSPTRIAIAFDPGGSGSRSLYHYDGRSHLLMMGSECLEVPLSLVRDRPVDPDSVDAVNRAWVRSQKSSQTCSVVGELAAGLKGQPAIGKAKTVTLLPKLQAMLGAICEELNLSEPMLEVDLAVHVPWSEYQKKVEIEQNITRNLKRFYFGDCRIEVRVERVRVYPEGFGVLYLNEKNGGQGKKLIWSFGYRNSSFIVHSKGSSPQGATSSYGSCRVVDRVMERYGLTDRAEVMRLVDAVVLGAGGAAPELRSLVGRLCSGSEQQQRLQTELVTTISEELDAYWALVYQWYQEHDPGPLANVVICGGTAALIRAKIQKFFGEFQIDWGTLWFDEISQLLAGSSREHVLFRQQQNARRCLDVFGTGRFLAEVS